MENGHQASDKAEINPGLLCGEMADSLLLRDGEADAGIFIRY